MGFECDNFPFTFKSGVISEADSLKNFEEGFFSALDASCNLFICNIFPQNTIKSKDSVDLDDCFIPSDETFTRKQLPHICPLLSHSFFDSNTPNHSHKLKFVVEYLVYLGLKRVAVKLDPLVTPHILQEILKISKVLKGARIGLIVIVSSGVNNEVNELNWKTYVTFRQQIGDKISCQLCLQTGDGKGTEGLEKWLGQRLVYVSFNQSAFIINEKGYPVLLKPYENFLKKILRSQTHIFITLKHCQKSKLSQFAYFAHILEKVTQNMTQYDIAAQQLIDYLQVPLQPYRDNLDAQIYDIFEKDAHKYEEYQIACREALQAIQEARTIVAYYVGSGKGLILEKFIRSAKKSQKKVKVYCIEKNPYPLQTLKRRIHKNKWTKFVEIVETDIKTYVMPQKPDIIFSELLGGFGDNQLSPECLKWAEKNITKDTIFIPQLYRSFIRPISAHNLHQQLSQSEKQQYFTVYLDKFYSPFHSQEAWIFKHPLPADDQLTRAASLEWQSKQLMLINGFEGSFDCTLLGKAYFSIVPENKDKNFYSWFPLYFAFTSEELLQKGEKITIDLLRKSNESRIWYQWRYSIKNVEGKTRKESKWHNENGSLAMQLEPEKDE